MLRASKIERGSCLQESTTTIRCTTFGSVWSVTVWFLKTAESIVVMLNHTSRRCPENSLLHALYTQYNDSLSPPSIAPYSRLLSIGSRMDSQQARSEWSNYTNTLVETNTLDTYAKRISPDLDIQVALFVAENNIAMAAMESSSFSSLFDAYQAKGKRFSRKHITDVSLPKFEKRMKDCYIQW